MLQIVHNQIIAVEERQLQEPSTVVAIDQIKEALREETKDFFPLLGYLKVSLQYVPSKIPSSSNGRCESS